jgi:Phasin protein
MILNYPVTVLANDKRHELLLSGRTGMNNQAHTAQHYDVDFAPAMRMYLETMENWKKNYERLIANAGGAMANNGSGAAAGFDNPMANWQQASATAFKRMFDQQVELCRFFSRRWERYLDLPQKLARCKTPVEFAQLQMDFLNRMSTEYMQESAKLAQPLTQMATAWSGERAAS